MCNLPEVDPSWEKRIIELGCGLMGVSVGVEGVWMGWGHGWDGGMDRVS